MHRDKHKKYIYFISSPIFSTGYREILPQGHSKSVFISLHGALVSTHQEYGMKACSPDLVAGINRFGYEAGNWPRHDMHGSVGGGPKFKHAMIKMHIFQNSVKVTSLWYFTTLFVKCGLFWSTIEL